MNKLINISQKQVYLTILSHRNQTKFASFSFMHKKAAVHIHYPFNYVHIFCLHHRNAFGDRVKYFTGLLTLLPILYGLLIVCPSNLYFEERVLCKSNISLVKMSIFQWTALENVRPKVIVSMLEFTVPFKNVYVYKKFVDESSFLRK